MFLQAYEENPPTDIKIINDISELIEISESTLYPILRRLEAQDMLRTFSKDFNGRVRKYYEITRLGEKRIRDFIDEWKDMERVYDFIRRRDR